MRWRTGLTFLLATLGCARAEDTAEAGANPLNTLLPQSVGVEDFQRCIHSRLPRYVRGAEKTANAIAEQCAGGHDGLVRLYGTGEHRISIGRDAQTGWEVELALGHGSGCVVYSKHVHAYLRYALLFSERACRCAGAAIGAQGADIGQYVCLPSSQAATWRAPRFVARGDRLFDALHGMVRSDDSFGFFELYKQRLSTDGVELRDRAGLFEAAAALSEGRVHSLRIVSLTSVSQDARPRERIFMSRAALAALRAELEADLTSPPDALTDPQAIRPDWALDQWPVEGNSSTLLPRVARVGDKARLANARRRVESAIRAAGRAREPVERVAVCSADPDDVFAIEYRARERRVSLEVLLDNASE